MSVSARFLIVAMLTLPSATFAAPPTRETVLSESQAIVGKLTSRSERSAALSVGDFAGAVEMAQLIPSPAHRAIALAGIVRDAPTTN